MHRWFPCGSKAVVMKIRSMLAPLALSFAAPFALAQGAGAPSPNDFLQAPEVVPSPLTGPSVEPDITIREERDRTVFEYRIKGQLYMIKIQPKWGPPYYLLDTDGDGVLDARSDSPTDVGINQWVIYSWD